MDRLEKFISSTWDYLLAIEWGKIPFLQRDASIFDAAIALISLFLTWKAFKLQKISHKDEINEKESLILKPLQVYSFDYPIDNRIVYFAPFESNQLNYKSRNTFAVPIDISIVNQNTKSVEGVELYLKINESVYRTQGTERVVDRIAAASGVVIASETINDEKLITVYWKLGHISPESSTNIRDLIFSSHPTDDVEISVDATTKDNVDITARVNINLSFTFEVKIICKDLKPQIARTQIGFRKIPKTGISKAKIIEYLTDRRKSKDKTGEVDEQASTYVMFEEFVRANCDIQAHADLESMLRKKGRKYREQIDELVPSRFKSEAQASEFLWGLSKKQILQGQKVTACAITARNDTDGR